MRSGTDASSATSAPASVSSGTANADSASCARTRADAWCSRPMAGRADFCVDPIEKKPLNQFLPGTPVLSFGTAGCNLTCKFCQNWDISKSREVDTLADAAAPETLAEAALRLGCRSVAYTYNDPTIFFGVRDRRRQGLQRGRREIGGGDGRLYRAGGARGVLHLHGTPPTSTSRHSPRTSITSSARESLRACSTR